MIKGQFSAVVVTVMAMANMSLMVVLAMAKMNMSLTAVVMEMVKMWSLRLRKSLTQC